MRTHVPVLVGLVLVGAVSLGGAAPVAAQAFVREQAPTDRAADIPVQVLAKEMDMMEAEGTSTVRLLEGGTHNVNIRHDENITRETSLVRSHPETVDVWVVQRGSGVLVTGGEMVNGEHVGGVERVIAAGDVIFIPAGTLHGIRETQSITWLNIRYDMPPAGLDEVTGRNRPADGRSRS